MYWSVYDTFLLLSGLITAAIAFVPIPTIPSKTRVTAGAVGGGIILLSLILGNMPSFTYPAIVFAAPLIALFVGGVVIKSALELKDQQEAAAKDPHHGHIQYGEKGHAVATSVAAEPPLPARVEVIAATPVIPPRPPAPVVDPRTDAWAELHDPVTPADRLAEIAGAHPEFAATIADHPNAYPELRAWAASVTAGGSA
ncbi:MAG: hypothetical protein GX868_08775 [Actinobacteria bacterium]|nr:hypothetical protein [Actinomycetota bacterium]